MQRYLATNNDVSAAAVVVYCLANLCDPLVDLNGRILGAIATASGKWGQFQPNNVVIMGHSLGAVGARSFVDYRRHNNETYGGLAMFGVCLNGDTEDGSIGILGYPLNFGAYPTPLLALAGELDFTPISHVALLYAQWVNFSSVQEQLSKVAVVIPSMDHSDFCPGYHVPWDIRSELSPADATAKIGAVVGAWVAVLYQGAAKAPRAASTLLAAAQSSAPMLKPFLAAYTLEQSWCSAWQLYVAEQRPNAYVTNVTVVDSLVQLAFAHPSYQVTSNGDLDMINVVYYQPDLFDFKQGNTVGALQVACKAVSRARVNSLLKGGNATEPTCRELNEQAVASAYRWLNASWPQALKRNAEHGGGFALQDDKMVGSGPTWVAEGLQFARLNGARDASVTSVAIVTSLNSFIYPGSHYCKLLSPARALEWLQTTSLTNRYNNNNNA